MSKLRNLMRGEKVLKFPVSSLENVGIYTCAEGHSLIVYTIYGRFVLRYLLTLSYCFTTII